MAAGQLLGLAVDLSGELAEGDDRAGEGDRADEDAEEDLDLQNADFDPGLVRQNAGKARQRLAGGCVKASSPRRARYGR
jgi:hypothetical protein